MLQRHSPATTLVRAEQKAPLLPTRCRLWRREYIGVLGVALDQLWLEVTG
jgi:hypothetical protein